MRGHLLVADDEPEQRELLEELLSAEDYTVTAAEDGRQALALLDGRTFDAVISDIAMPGATGLELLRSVRARDLDLPVLLLTGRPDLDSAARAVNDGAFRYLVKPVAPSRLASEVSAAVRLHRLARLKREALTHLGRSDRLAADRAGLEAVFARALGSLWIAYQPIRRASGESYGAEALVRSGSESLASAAALLDAAERLGRMPELGGLIRERVAEFLGTRASAERTFVNLHPLELRHERLYETSGPLAAHAGSVVLEITERASIEDVGDVRSRVRRLKELGYRIAVDDLGAGYAGLSSFVALEPDVVKLDASLVRGLDREPVRRRLIESLAGMCREAGILVVAEGIETEAERASVVDAGCDLLQGFLLGRPARPGPAPGPV